MITYYLANNKVLFFSTLQVNSRLKSVSIIIQQKNDTFFKAENEPKFICRNYYVVYALYHCQLVKKMMVSIGNACNIENENKLYIIEMAYLCKLIVCFCPSISCLVLMSLFDI